MAFVKPVFVAGLALCALASPAAAQNRPVQVAAQMAKPAAQAPTLAPPPTEALVIMIRSSLLALSQANVTNNYSVLSALGSPSFRATNPPARLAEIFASFRSNKIDMNPVAFVPPQLTRQPAIENGKLRLVGIFPTAPMQVSYDLTFEPDGGNWKLFGLAVNLNKAQGAQQAIPGR